MVEPRLEPGRVVVCEERDLEKALMNTDNSKLDRDRRQAELALEAKKKEEAK